MSSLQSIMNLDDDQQDVSSPMNDKRNQEAASPASGFRTQDPSTSSSSLPSGHAIRTKEPSSSTLQPPAIRLPALEQSHIAHSISSQLVDTEPRSSSSAQQGKRPADPSTVVPVLSAASSATGGSRRQSNTSVDSMDQHGYGSASSSSVGGGAGGGGGGYPTNHPRRPVGSPSPDVQIRLTPITGRVSRAKKGVPVHACNTCNPPKIFTRAEHLRRHQLSHQQPQYGCDKCDRAFHRLDLLTRHQQRHNEEGDKASGSRRGSQQPGGMSSQQQPGHTPASSSAGYGGESTTNSTMSEMLPATSLGRGQPGATISSRQPSDDQYRPLPEDHASYDPMYEVRSGVPIIDQPGSIESSPEPPAFGHLACVPRTAEVPMFMTTEGSMLQTASEPPELIPTWTSASESNYSTPSEVSSRQKYLRPASQNPMEWQTSASLLSAYPAVSRQGISTTGGLEAMAVPYYVSSAFPGSPELVSHISASLPSYEALLSEPLLSTAFPDGQTQVLLDPAIAEMHRRSSSVRSPPPSSSASISRQVADTLVTPAPLHPRIDPLAQARHKELVVEVLGVHGASPQWRVDVANGHGIPTGPSLANSGSFGLGMGFFTSLPRSIRNAIPTYINVYWERFHVNYPIVHRRSFEEAGEESLRCAMAAIATQFMTGKEDRIRGSQLHEYAWQEAKRAPQENLQVMQAILLCEYFARFRGRKAAVRPSKLFENLYSRVLDHSASSYEAPMPLSAASFERHQITGISTSLEQQWRTWVDSESRRRLLAACFIFDNHASVLHQQPRAVDDVDPSTLPLTAHADALWAAQSAHEWAATLEPNPAAAQRRYLPRLDTLRPEEVIRYSPLDKAAVLNAAAHNLPRRRVSSLAGDVGNVQKATGTQRTPTSESYANPMRADDHLEYLFSCCAPGSTADVYIALHHTPLHDLLAVSGDTWMFSQKVPDALTFLEHQKRLKSWAEGRGCNSASQHHHHSSGSPVSPITASLEGMSAPRAMIHAARALLWYLEGNTEASDDGARTSMACLSDYWAVYVCALIIWAFGHRAGKSSSSSSSSSSAPAGLGSATTKKGSVALMSEDEAVNWLRVVAENGRPEHVARVRGRREASAAVVTLVRRRLEADCVGDRNWLYVDAVSVLRKLEEEVNRRWF